MATDVYAYHGGTSEEDGRKAHPRVWEAAHGIGQLGSHLARLNDWADETPGHGRAPQVRFGAVAAGEVVQDSRISADAQWIRQHYNDALAIEMEAAGVAQAEHLNGAPVAIIRGISDRADGTKSSAKDRNWQPRAAANAAAFGIRLAVELMQEQEQIAMAQVDRAHGDEAQAADRHADQISNTAHNSTVGIMAGSVRESSVHVNAAPKVSSATDLVAELDGFHERLERHHAEGTLDADTYREALAELGLARQGGAGALIGIREEGDHGTQAVARPRRGVSRFGGYAGTAVVAAGALS